MKTHIRIRQDPEELKIEGLPNSGLLPWRANQVLISKKFFHAWIFSTIGKELSISGNDITNIEITDEGLEDVVFLISAGPFANILVQQLNEHNKNNTYIDLGSVLDKHLSLPATRKYLNGGPTLNKTCIW